MKSSQEAAIICNILSMSFLQKGKLTHSSMIKCSPYKQKTLMWPWNCYGRQRRWRTKAISTERLPTITLHAFSEEPKNWGRHWATSRKRWKLSTTTCISQMRRWTSACRYWTQRISTSTSAPSSVRWASMSWPCSTPWRHSFLSKMNWWPRSWTRRPRAWKLRSQKTV